MSTKSTGEAEASDPKPKGGEESEEESDVLEESPCGRWQKRREEVRTWVFDVLDIVVHGIPILTEINFKEKLFVLLILFEERYSICMKAM